MVHGFRNHLETQMHIDTEIVNAIHNANETNTEISTMEPSTIIENEQHIPTLEDDMTEEQEDARDLAAQNNEAKRIHDANYARSHDEPDPRVTMIFDQYRGLFPDEIRYATQSSIASLAKGCIRQWAWNEVLIRASKNPQTVKDAEQRQARSASLYATYFGLLPKDKRPDIGSAIGAELSRDPNRDITDDENLAETAKILGMTVEALKAEMPDLVAGAQDSTWEKLKKELLTNRLPNLVRQFQHTVAAYGPRPIDLREITTLVEWTYGSLIGDEDKGYQGLIDRQKLRVAQARTPARKREAGGNYHLLVAAANGLERLAEKCASLEKQDQAAGYDVADAWNAMH